MCLLWPCLALAAGGEPVEPAAKLQSGQQAAPGRVNTPAAAASHLRLRASAPSPAEAAGARRRAGLSAQGLTGPIQRGGKVGPAAGIALQPLARLPEPGGIGPGIAVTRVSAPAVPAAAPGRSAIAPLVPVRFAKVPPSSAPSIGKGLIRGPAAATVRGSSEGSLSAGRIGKAGIDGSQVRRR
jgi:hypothetical protein